MTPPATSPPEQVPGSSEPLTAIRTARTNGNPMQQYEVQSILGHRRYRNAYLYRVRWAPPYDDDSEITEERERSFGRASLRELPPALTEYWMRFPRKERPAAYRHLADANTSGGSVNAPAVQSEPVPVTPARKRRRGAKKSKATPLSGTEKRSKRQKSVASQN